MTVLTFTASSTAAQINQAIRDADDSAPLEVRLAAGVYDLDAQIKILRSDVTFTGAGVGRTILRVAQSAEGNAQAIEVASHSETYVSLLAGSTTAGSSMEITLEDAAGIGVGAVILIEQANTQAWFDQTGNGHLDAATENADGHLLRQMLAEVIAVNGDRLTLRTSTPYDFTGTQSGEPVVARVSIPHLLTGIEISGFTVTTNLPGTPDGDDFTNLYPAYDSPSNNAAIEVTGVRGLSLHDVATLNTASTAFDLSLIYGSTIGNLEARGSFNKGVDGNGYAFLLKTAFNNTLTNLVDVDMRHSLIFGSFTAEHYNTIHVASTNRDINFHGSPDSGNTIVVDSSTLEFPRFEGSKSAVQIGNQEIHPRSTIEDNDITFRFLSGSFAQDVVHGHDDGSELWGNQNGDTLYGGAGDDILSGGIDNDIVQGNGGQDRFIFRRAYEQDVVTDFQTGGVGDILDLARTGISGRDGLSSRQVGEDTVVSLGGGDSLTLTGIDAAEFAAMTIRFDASVRPVSLEAWGSDLGFSGSAGDDTFSLRPGNFTNGSRPDLLGMGGRDTLAMISGSSFDSALAGRVVGIDAIDMTRTPNLAQVSLTRDFVAQSDAGHVTVVCDDTGMFLKTNDISDWNAVRLSGDGLVTLSAQGVAVSAGAGAITVRGGAGRDAIKGREGDDHIDGGGGRDILRGGGGNDSFVFTRLAGSASADVISDFTNASGNDDRFEIDNAAFLGLYDGALSSSRFQLISGPNLRAGVDDNDRILYDRANGDVYFDRDGSGRDYDALRIAEVSDGMLLSHHDFFIL